MLGPGGRPGSDPRHWSAHERTTGGLDHGSPRFTGDWPGDRIPSSCPSSIHTGRSVSRLAKGIPMTSVAPMAPEGPRSSHPRRAAQRRPSARLALRLGLGSLLSWVGLLGLGGAPSQGIAKDNPHDAPPLRSSDAPAAGLTRAEVLADLQIYRESGMALTDQSESFGYGISAAAAAQARYQSLRNSPYYASLVQRYGGTSAGTAVGSASGTASSAGAPTRLAAPGATGVTAGGPRPD